MEMYVVVGFMFLAPWLVLVRGLSRGMVGVWGIARERDSRSVSISAALDVRRPIQTNGRVAVSASETPTRSAFLIVNENEAIQYSTLGALGGRVYRERY